MKKKIILFITILCTVTLLTGCDLFKNKPTKPVETPKPLEIGPEDAEYMEKVSNLAFIVEKESLKVEDYTAAQKAEIARNIPEEGYLNTTGTKMEEEFKKYFGKDQTVSFGDINCFMQHENANEQVLYFFDQEKDQYVYNDNHPGHGGGGVTHIEYKSEYVDVSLTSTSVTYNKKVLFFGPVVCSDIGPCDYGKVYKSYKDAMAGRDELLDINNSLYVSEDPDTGLPSANLDQIFNDYKDQADTYGFTFEKEDDHLVFKSYERVS